MTNQNPTDYMQTALRLAERGRFTVAPNPVVGCVIVKNHQIVGKGFHEKPGQAHAEIVALQDAKGDAHNAHMYVTLEPCVHHGRTPPCVDALIQKKIKKVYIATLDPNPKVSGKGMAALKKAGISVDVGLCEVQAKLQNEAFFHFMKKQQPFVIAKWAMSLDGKTTTHDTPEITASDAQKHCHFLRASVDAILIGSRTAMLDNPQLTVRLAEQEKYHHPIRFILTAKGNLPLSLKVFSGELPGKTVIVTTDQANTTWLKAAEKTSDILLLPQDENQQVDLQALLIALGNRNITSLLVEGGMTVHHRFFAKQLINKLYTYVAPIFIGETAPKAILSLSSIMPLGRDTCFTTYLPESYHV